MSFNKKCRFVICIFAYILVLEVGCHYSFFFTEIVGTSMEPTLLSGDVYKVKRVRHPDELGEDYPICVVSTRKDVYIVKRLVGYPGDVVTLLDGDTYVNGELIMCRGKGTWDNMDFSVPSDGYLFLGDNRLTSYDARFWNEPYLKFDQIVGILPDSNLKVR